MMTLVMGVRDPVALARATDLGIAMQLTNIARDVGEDAANGRLYLPRAWLADVGIDPDAWRRAPVFDDRSAAVVRRLLESADHLYARATPGIAKLPLGCRPAMLAARRLYAEIGREVERAQFDSMSRRAVVPARRKAALLALAFAEAPILTSPRGGACLARGAVPHRRDRELRARRCRPTSLVGGQPRPRPHAGAHRRRRGPQRRPAIDDRPDHHAPGIAKRKHEQLPDHPDRGHSGLRRRSRLRHLAAARAQEARDATGRQTIGRRPRTSRSSSAARSRTPSRSCP